MKQPTHLRSAIPCWDEPLLKASYSVKMLSRSGLVNLSNMPVTSEVTLDASENEEAKALVPAEKLKEVSFGSISLVYGLKFVT